jgi:hypothetical protein
LDRIAKPPRRIEHVIRRYSSREVSTQEFTGDFERFAVETFIARIL